VFDVSSLQDSLRSVGLGPPSWAFVGRSYPTFFFRQNMSSVCPIYKIYLSFLCASGIVENRRYHRMPEIESRNGRYTGDKI
jgi:hypothetical protein